MNYEYIFIVKYPLQSRMTYVCHRNSGNLGYLCIKAVFILNLFIICFQADIFIWRLK